MQTKQFIITENAYGDAQTTFSFVLQKFLKKTTKKIELVYAYAIKELYNG